MMLSETERERESGDLAIRYLAENYKRDCSCTIMVHYEFTPSEPHRCESSLHVLRISLVPRRNPPVQIASDVEIIEAKAVVNVEEVAVSRSRLTPKESRVRFSHSVPESLTGSKHRDCRHHGYRLYADIAHESHHTETERSLSFATELALASL